MEIVTSFRRQANGDQMREVQEIVVRQAKPYRTSAGGEAALSPRHRFTLVLRSRDAILSTALDRLHPGRRSSDPELKQSWETPSRHEYCQSAPTPSSSVRCPKQFPHGAVFRKRGRQEKNQNGRAHSL